MPSTSFDLSTFVSCKDFERKAREVLPHRAFEYVGGGAGSGHTLRKNRASFNRLLLLPRVLRDVSQIRTDLQLFGRTHPYPIFLAAAGYHKLMHPRGELETVAGANQAESLLCAASFSNYTIEEMAAASNQPLWFQLYVQNDRAFTKDLVQRALGSGCEAICVTVDSPTNSPRDRELRAGFALPPGAERANLRSLGSYLAGAPHRPNGRNIYTATHAANVTWKDIEWLRFFISGELLVKGILHPDDAELACQAGCDGIIVSNHGARSLDTVPATIDMLPAIAERVNGRIPILLDGGIRRGIDVFKAIALGAKAVFIGRPYLWALAVGGSAGLVRVMEILRTELEMTMGLAGCQDLDSIDRQYIWGDRRKKEDFGAASGI